MERVPVTPPIIPPLLTSTKHPLWSVMIPAYYCSTYLVYAINSVLQQDLGRDLMQIEVVDDHCTDVDVEELVKEIGKDRVSYFRQKQNVGSLRNFETCINRAKGEYVHLLQGDDFVKPGFYKNLTSLTEMFPEAGAVCCSWDYIDDNNNILSFSTIEADQPCILENWLYKLCERQRHQYVSIVVKREVYENLGSFYGVIYGEDWEMWARIAKFYPIAYFPGHLAAYREHREHAISTKCFTNGENIRQIVKVLDTICQYLPLEDQYRLNRLAKKHYMYWVFGYINKVWVTTRNKEVVFKQMKEMLTAYPDIKLLIKNINLLRHILQYSCLQKLRGDNKRKYLYREHSI